MRLVVQRVRRAVVRVHEQVVGQVGEGALVLAGVATTDTPDRIDRMADKLAGLRFCRDEAGRTNRSLLDTGGGVLVVSQFTLLADLRRGRRPGFTAAAAPDMAVPLLDRFVDRLRDAGLSVETGRFGAEMMVELENDGPFTLVIDSEWDLAGADDARVD